MKVGILTFPNSTSYGATLQMYALYRTVNKLGHSASVINYHNEYMKAYKHTLGSGSLTARLKRRASYFMHSRLYRNFRSFEKRNMSFLPEKSFSDKSKLVSIGGGLDAAICGSDQVWNPDITDSDLSFFLDFCGDRTRRISYAPSFGVESISPELSGAVASELEKFHAVSVREEKGRELVLGMTGKDVPVVVDPTMLVSAEEWSALEREYPVGEGGYILYYTIRRSHSLMQFCRELSARTGLRVIAVGGNFIKSMKTRGSSIEYASDISPEQWLYLVNHARYVVTNSFHGTAFSINFRKDFYVEFSSATNSRLENITGMLGLESRVVREGMAAEPSDCDYSVAQERLPSLIADSHKFLKEALNQGENDG
ncbi:MAG: polysaccharide pyruvyl transferase family protein [Clostridia bacterium]|nr:polysaccharide pyruvyl transferase family protein [Clostridia bacterium]